MDLKGKVALVTGGGRRVGRGLAEALGEHGATVAVHYGESRKGADEVVRALGTRARAFGADLTVAGAPEKLIEDVVSAFGRLDVLVNSAAIMIRTPIGEVDVATWDRMFALNLRAVFFLSQAAAPHLRNSRGTIVNIADLAAFETWPGYIPHGITKAGVVQLTRNFARVLAPDVRVNGIAPGSVLMPDAMSDAEVAAFNKHTPLGRVGSPADVVSAMMYLIGADYVTGEIIIVDGGRHVRSSTT